MKPISDIEPLLTARQVRAILQCSLPAVYKMAERKQLPCVRWQCLGQGKKKPSMVRFEMPAVKQFIEDNRK